MTKEDLALYEAPALSEFVSNPLIQTLLAGYIAWKVNRKLARLQKRKSRAAFFTSYLK